MTQVELAAQLGVSFATVNRWEKGHHEPTIKQKRNIRDFCKKHKIRVEGENK
ncbi:MAG: helix-turn-helix transcriptional regulator [Bacilli bacterium]|nr:helix-turn-helix transcriptional regulator [Bacilli bacterium]